MLSKEEKEAIEDIDLFIHDLNYGEMKMTIASERQKEIAQELQMLLNLLNKQQKEIYRLQNIKRKDIEDLINNEKENIYINYISKDKIRKKKINQFREVKKEILKNENELQRVSITYDIIRNDYCEKMLKELLEEE